MPEDPILAFARDFSGNDEAIAAQVRAYVSDPPTDQEAIGFYGSDSYGPRARAFLATVSLLAEKGKLHTIEDKYTRELLVRWIEEGVIDVATLPPAAKAVFVPILRERERPKITMIFSLMTHRKTAWNRYAKATEELEQHIAARGKVLLSIDATEDCDTMFFALVDPDVAARWRGKALSEEDGHVAGVRPPLWDRFWDHLSYSTDLLDGAPSGYPPGTRMREPILPFAE